MPNRCMIWILMVLAIPAFQVASIKPNHSGQREQFYQILPGGRLRASNISLKMLIKVAYDVQDFQISGGPAWLYSDRYDIEAKAEKPPTENQQDTFRLMIQSLLAERFNLALHKESTQGPVYALIVAKGGSKMHPSPIEDATDPGPYHLGLGEIDGTRVEITSLARLLSISLNRTVIDKTGLKGKYDIRLRWAPDENQAKILGFDNMDSHPPPDQSGPNLFTAIQQQLSLKLQPTKGPVLNLVIDRAEKPSAN